MYLPIPGVEDKAYVAADQSYRQHLIVAMSDPSNLIAIDDVKFSTIQR